MMILKHEKATAAAMGQVEVKDTQTLEFQLPSITMQHATPKRCFIVEDFMFESIDSRWSVVK
jgi:hypothetical protein